MILNDAVLDLALAPEPAASASSFSQILKALTRYVKEPGKNCLDVFLTSTLYSSSIFNLISRYIVVITFQFFFGVTEWLFVQHLACEFLLA